MSDAQLTVKHLQKERLLPQSSPTPLHTASLDFSSSPQIPANSPSLFLQLSHHHFFYGPVVKGKAEGSCIYVYSDGAYFKGECKGGKFEGKGALFKFGDDFKEKIFWYEGEWRDSRPHGRGRQEILNSMVYEGSFVRGKKTGEGIMTYIDGSQYKGLFFDNQVQGEGTYRSKVHEWSGHWQQGYLQGEGQQVSKGLADEDTEENCISVYNGGFERGLKHGRGTYKWGKNFSEYSGTFSYGQLDGEGRFKLGEAEYRGVWKKGVEVSLQSTIQFKRVKDHK